MSAGRPDEDRALQIGVIGGGRVGAGLAELWRRAGRDVRVSTRETVAETAAHGEVVLLAVPASSAAGALAAAGPLAGKVLVDATNDVSGGPGRSAIAELAPDARYVKAFNTVFAALHGEPPPVAGPPALLLCGDDAAAKAVVGRLARDAGYEPFDAGGLDRTPLVEAFARLVIGLAYRQGLGPFFVRFELPRR